MPELEEQRINNLAGSTKKASKVLNIELLHLLNKIGCKYNLEDSRK